MRHDRKHVEWLGSTRKDIRELPEDMQDAIGTDLLDVQYGGRPVSAKTWSGSIQEIRQRDKDNTYRLVYIAKFEECVYVLHVFTKKSTSGFVTLKPDKDIIDMRYGEAIKLHQEWEKANE